MPDPLHLFDVGLSCGHRFWFKQYLNLAPQPGDETYCMEHGGKVTVTDCVDNGVAVDQAPQGTELTGGDDGFVWSW